MPDNTGRSRGDEPSEAGFEDSDFGDELTRAVAQGPSLLRLPVRGEQLGGQDGHRFQILESLGGGAMSRVFRAWDAQLRREVALKFLHPRSPLGEEHSVSLLQKEAQAIAQLAHPNIIRLFDTAEWAGAPWEPRIPFLIMECLEGESLSVVLRREQRLEPRRALEILTSIAAGLAHAHEHHVIHRDLKPSNVFLTRRGEVKLLDFGLAWRMEEEDPAILDLPNAGTPAYMAPEQWRSARQDERTDIWSAGVVLYEMLTGTLPYPDVTMQELRTWVLSDEPVPPARERNPALPREVEPLLAAMLAKAPERRYQTAQELEEELRELTGRLRYQARAPGALAAERRQVTLVSCRLTGLEGLAEPMDSEGIGELEEAFQQRCAELVQQRGGSMTLYLGDEVLACFGYPVAREEDSEHAVQVGLALARDVPATLQRKLPHLPPGVLALRVGIHTDQMTLGEHEREQATRALILQGEAPKVATWLAQQAEPHAVVISEATWALVHGMFETEALGALPYQGLSGPRPLGLHRVLRERPATFRFERALAAAGGLTPLVGREDELRRLLACWSEARRGKGSFVLVTGEAGLGKSRLIQELHQRVCQERYIHFQAQCWPQSSTSALQPAIEVLRHFFPSRELSPGALGLSPEQVSLLVQLLSQPLPEGLPSPRLSPERLKERTFEAVAALLSRVARRYPVLGVVEDLHWADPSTLELLGYLLARLEKERILFVLSARPDFHPTWPQRPWMHTLTLERLSPELTATLVRESAHGRALPPELIPRLVARTDGIPLFVEEMTRMVLEHGTPGSIPITLNELLMARLDLLPARQKTLAQSCAALGRGFSHALLASLTRRSPASLRRDLEGLVAAGVLQPQDEDTGAGYQFRHALLQDAARRSLPLGARRRLHQRITQALLEQSPEVAETQPELLAHHYMEAGEYTRALPYWERAGQRASLRSANHEAVSHFQQALRMLRLMPEGPSRLELELRLLISLGPPLALVRGYLSAEVERTYTRAHELIHQVGEALPRLRLGYFGLFAYFFSRAEYAQAHELAEQLVARGERHQDRELLALGHRMMVADCFIWGRMHEALEHVQRTLESSDLPLEEQRAMAELQWINPRATALAFGAMVQSVLGRNEEAHRYGHEALELARRLGHAHTSASVLTYLAVACQLRGETQCALEWSTEAIALSNEHGFRAWCIWSTLIRIWALTERGELREGLVLMRETMRGWEEPGIRSGQRHHDLGLLAGLYLKQGQPRGALEVTTEALERAKTTGEHFYEAELLRLHGEALWALGHEPEAREYFQRAIQVAHEQGASAFEQRALDDLAALPPEQPPA